MPARLMAARRPARTGRNAIVRRRRPEAADGRSPFLHGRQMTVGERRVESALVRRRGAGELGGSGGSSVGRVDAGGGPPHRHLFDELPVGAAAGREPVRHVRCRGLDLGGEVVDQVGAAA